MTQNAIKTRSQTKTKLIIRGERGGGGLMFGMIKNLLVGIVVALVVVPTGWMPRGMRTAQVAG